MTSNARNIAERVVWTFIQAFVGALPVTWILDKQHLEASAYAGLTAGIAAVVSLGKNLTAKGTQPTAIGVPQVVVHTAGSTVNLSGGSAASTTAKKTPAKRTTKTPRP